MQKRPESLDMAWAWPVSGEGLPISRRVKDWAVTQGNSSSNNNNDSNDDNAMTVIMSRVIIVRMVDIQ